MVCCRRNLLPLVHFFDIFIFHLHSKLHNFELPVYCNSYRHRNHPGACSSVWNNSTDNRKPSVNSGIFNTFQSECKSRPNSNDIRFWRIRRYTSLFLPMACNRSRWKHLYFFRGRFSIQLICYYYHLLFCYFNFYPYWYLWI